MKKIREHYTVVDKSGHCVTCGMDDKTEVLSVRKVDIMLCNMMGKGMADSEKIYIDKMLSEKLMVNTDCMLPLRIAKVEVTRTIKEL